MKFTKHFYIEGQRIVSKLGDMGKNQELLNPKDTTRAGNNGNHPIDWDNKHEHLKDQLIANFEELGLTGAVFTAGKSGKVPYGQIKKYYRNSEGIIDGYGSDSTSTRNYDGNKAELSQFYYHPDHLGSSNYITNVSGEVYQHMEYFPFGETFIEERNGTDYTNYLYNGKEFDEEIGLYYYGARYYDPKISMWYGVDRMAEKYAAFSPYTYCLNNPIIFIDPDGNEVGVAYLSAKHQVSLNNILSTSAGRVFVGRYMQAGQELSVGNKTYTWNKSGDRSKDFLQISSIANLGRKGLNSTMKKGTYRTTNALTPSEMAETAVEGVYQAIQLDLDLSSGSATDVLGHEAFVHADKDADRLTNLDEKMGSGKATEKDVIKTMVEVSTSGAADHKVLGEGKVKKYESMSNELSNKTGNKYYKNAYKKQIEKYKEK
ncbi:MAG: hypothetical protein GQ564_20420 [Bacteroidales bacterium]|nr:hypothetical protein [Bacteroidales bacterium]